MRSDARRNRRQILDAAEESFAEDGLGVTVDAIARRAGVGAGTIYRHFPTKEALFAAVAIQHMTALAAEARDLAELDDPGQALFEFMTRLAEKAASKRDLMEALVGAGVDVQEELGEHKALIEHSFQVLLERAKAAGEIRTDVDVADVLCLVMGTCTLAGNRPEPASQSRMLAVVCDGLRPGAPAN